MAAQDLTNSRHFTESIARRTVLHECKHSALLQAETVLVAEVRPLLPSKPELALL